MPECKVCRAPIDRAIYRSAESRSVTSMCEFYEGATEVFFCETCGHLQTNEIKNIGAYYDTQYNIFISDEEEDSLYSVVDGRKTFRVEHQVNTILSKLTLPQGARVLDFGCAKSATGRKLQAARPDISLHLFDVSRAYVQFWEKFLPADRWAVYEAPDAWNGSFDAVLSFFALEHTSSPREFVANLARLIRPGGYLHLLVPNVYQNSGDFVVVDHVNHFSAASLRYLFSNTGFDSIAVDDQAHDAAFVVTARRAPDARTEVPDSREIERLRQLVGEAARFWSALSERVRAFETGSGGRPAAIYGSGFYGTFIASCLARMGEVRYFLDQNPFRQAQTLLNKAIIAPDKVDADIDVVYVGLNPRIARDAISKVPALSARERSFFYLT
jgi:cyclopropane fatty-acyl-phospholipid synthase-like methyltransferase